MRKIALPFDWLRSNDINDIISNIDNKFQYFFNDIEVSINDSDKFLSIDDNWLESNLINKYKIKNKYFIFPHDKIDDFKDKYTRRINRFYEILNNDKIKKVFIRISKKDEKKDIIKLEETLKKFNNNFIVKNYKYDKKMIFSSWQKNELNWNNIIFN